MVEEANPSVGDLAHEIVNDELLSAVNAVRGRFFLDASQVKSAHIEGHANRPNIHLRKELPQINYEASLDGSWKMSIDFEEGSVNVSADLGVKIDPNTGKQVPFIKRDLIDGEDASTTEAQAAVVVVNKDLDKLLVQPAPYVREPSRITTVVDLSGPTTGQSMLLSDFIEEQFGHEAGEKWRREDEEKARRLREKKEKLAPFNQRLLAIKDKIGILNPASPIQDAEIDFFDGTHMNPSFGGEYAPDFWAVSIFVNDGKGKITVYRIGYSSHPKNEYDALSFQGPYAEIWRAGEKGREVTIEGEEAIREIDGFIGNSFKRPQQTSLSN